MDLNALKQKLDTLQSKPQGQKTDYSTIFWRPTVGKQQIILHLCNRGYHRQCLKGGSRKI